MAELFLRPAAQEDIQRVVEYYDEISLNLSNHFLNDLESVILKIEDNPNAYQRRIGEVRIAFLRKFPFGVFYKIYETRISVIAILHTSQDSGKWLGGR